MKKYKLQDLVSNGSHSRLKVDSDLLVGDIENGYGYGDILDANATKDVASNIAASAVAAAKTVVAQATNDYITVTPSTDSTDGHAIYTIGTTGIDAAIAAAVAGIMGTGEIADAYDTIKEIADWITTDTTGAAAILANVADKANKVAMSGNGAATQGNFFAISATGDLADSGYSASSFQAALGTDSTHGGTFLRKDGTWQVPDKSDKEDKLTVLSYDTAPGSISAIASRYYRIDANVNTLAVILPDVSNITNAASVMLFLTTGTTPNITITSTAPSGGTAPDVYYSDTYEIEAGNTYEINALWNGSAWVINSITIVVP